MLKSDYQRILTLVDEIKPKIQKAIDNLDNVSVPEQDKENLAENVVSTISVSYGEFIQTWRLLEVELTRLVRPFFPDERARRNVAPALAVRALKERGILADDSAQQIDQLSRARNAIIHGETSWSSEEDPMKINQDIQVMKDVINKLKTLS